MNRKTYRNILAASLMVVASVGFAATPLPDSAWKGTDIVFGSEHAGQTYELTSPATATSVSFVYPAMLIGSQVLTLDAPAGVTGAGSLLVPLAGSNGLSVETSIRRSPIVTFLSAESQVLWESCTLKDGCLIAAKLCGGFVAKPTDTTMYYFVKNGDVATAQFQCVDDKYVKVAKIQFEQAGVDVTAKIVWIKYGDKEDIGKDFESGSHVQGTYNPPYATTDRDNGRIGVKSVSYFLPCSGADAVELEGHLPSGTVALNAGRVAFRPQSDATIENALSGSATNLSVFGSASRQTFDLGSDFLTTGTKIKVADDAQLRSVKVVSALMSGGWINQRDIAEPTRYGYFRNERPDGVDYYIQFLDFGQGCPPEGYTKIVHIRFTSENGALYVQALGRCSRSGNWLGHDSSVYTSSYVNSVSSSATEGGYGIHNLVVSAITGEKTVRLSGSNANSLAAGLDVEANGAGLELTARGRLPGSFGLTLANGSVSTFSMPNLQATQANSSYMIDIVDDSVLSLGKAWNICEKAQVKLDGSLLALSYRDDINKDSCEYLERLTLRNKSQMTGFAYRVGYHEGLSYFLKSEGEGPNVVANGIIGVLVSGKTGEYVFDTATDLKVLGPLADLSETYKGLGWTKRGAATLTLAGANGTAAGPVRIEAGTLALGDEKIFTKSNPITLAGGTLEVGVMTNNFGALTLTGDSSIKLGSGCVTFADSTAKAWTSGAKLMLIGSDKKLLPGRVRVSTTAGGLTPEQVASIRYNSEDLSVQLDEDGWMISKKIGLIIVVQ